MPGAVPLQVQLHGVDGCEKGQSPQLQRRTEGCHFLLLLLLLCLWGFVEKKGNREVRCDRTPGRVGGIKNQILQLENFRTKTLAFEEVSLFGRPLLLHSFDSFVEIRNTHVSVIRLG
jgi:hypothetical protein